MLLRPLRCRSDNPPSGIRHTASARVVLQVGDHRRQRLAPRRSGGALSTVVAGHRSRSPLGPSRGRASDPRRTARPRRFLGVEAMCRGPESLPGGVQIQDPHGRRGVDSVRVPPGARSPSIRQTTGRSTPTLQVQVVEQGGKHRVLGREWFAIDVSTQLRPDVFVEGFGTVLGAFLAEYLVDDVLGRTHERCDAVDPRPRRPSASY